VTGVLPVRFSIRAADEIEAADRWWKANRAAATALSDELRRALDLIARQPAAGAPARNARLPGVRRVSLPRVGYHLYYRVTAGAVEVLAFWHVRRGEAAPV
jgi:plasmid stabilization system protein ParE